MSVTLYGSKAGLDQYIADRGYNISGLDVADEDEALARGTIALDAAYAARFVGTKLSYTQEREWPRTSAAWPDGTVISGVPNQVVLASYEAAFQEWRRPGSLTPVVTPGTVKRRARVEGAVDVSYWQDTLNPDVVQSMMPVLTVIEGLLFGLVGSRAALPGVAFV